MSINEAISIFKSAFSNYRVASYKDLNDMYVLEAYSSEYDAMDDPKIAMDPWYYVEKQTGALGHYYPFNYDPKQFFMTESISVL